MDKAGRWTADTEVAFLLALRLTGTMTAACEAIGRSTGATQKRRARLPDFEARCRAALDEHRCAAEGAGGDLRDVPDDAGEMPNRVRFDGWTPVRQRAFLRALTETGVYAAACRRVGLSKTSADRMRRRYPAFAAACERALGRFAGTLEQVAFERATIGWEEPIVHAGRVVGQRRRYSDVLLRLLIQREEKRPAATPTAKAKAAAPGGRRRPSTEEVNALLTTRLDALDRRAAADERERMLAWADEMVRRGLAP